MAPMKFSKHADHYAQHLDQAMKLDIPWAARAAYAVMILAEAVDGAEPETKADLNKILSHGLDLLVERGLAEKTDGGAYALVRGERAKAESMKVDAPEPEAAAPSEEQDQTPPEVA